MVCDSLRLGVGRELDLIEGPSDPEPLSIGPGKLEAILLGKSLGPGSLPLFQSGIDGKPVGTVTIRWVESIGDEEGANRLLMVLDKAFIKSWVSLGALDQGPTGQIAILSRKISMQTPTPGTIRATWEGGSGKWGEPERWQGGVIPRDEGDARYSIHILDVDQDLTIRVEQPVAVSDLVLGEVLVVEAGASLELTGLVDNRGELIAAGGALGLMGASVVNVGRAIVADGGLVQICDSRVSGGQLSLAAGEFANEGRIEITGGSEPGILWLDGDVSLRGAGEVALGPSLGVVRGPPSAVLTIGPEQHLGGHGGIETALINQGEVQASGGPLQISGWVENIGIIRSLSDGEMLIQGDLINLGALQARASQITVEGGLTLNHPGFLAAMDGGAYHLHKHLHGDTKNRDNFEPVEIHLDGTGTEMQQFEAMAQDRGPFDAGFADNFAFSTLILGERAWVRLVDLSDNSAGAEPETVYVQSLIVPAGATLDLGGLKLYARSAEVMGGVLGGEVLWVTDRIHIQARLTDRSIVLSWPLTMEDVVLQSTTALSVPTLWTTLTDPPPTSVENFWTVMVDLQEGGRFFRLSWPQ